MMKIYVGGEKSRVSGGEKTRGRKDWKLIQHSYDAPKKLSLSSVKKKMTKHIT